ncbi:MAG: hypothetical protein AVDCRST_MAG59-2075 [uncultured Thermomicrobiales bacterium]|uniref:Uncharacterized protein n=1 Tax=uncultured Thermomicrobiales bacterium TaxID=1645740 RepID=A0A6J4UMF8_9BACT|nr:MAG: hypothetical protein AVDCRST_MAG59-2075 [uncultured Thermomicrobiales bacterium]
MPARAGCEDNDQDCARAPGLGAGCIRGATCDDPSGIGDFCAVPCGFDAAGLRREDDGRAGDGPRSAACGQRQRPPREDPARIGRRRGAAMPPLAVVVQPVPAGGLRSRDFSQERGEGAGDAGQRAARVG